MRAASRRGRSTTRPKVREEADMDAYLKKVQSEAALKVQTATSRYSHFTSRSSEKIGCDIVL